jgi:hypothetical protein
VLQGKCDDGKEGCHVQCRYSPLNATVYFKPYSVMVMEDLKMQHFTPTVTNTKEQIFFFLIFPLCSEYYKKLKYQHQTVFKLISGTVNIIIINE